MTRVFVSSVIDSSVDDVWNIIRDFNNLPGWLPVVSDSVIENGRASDSIGCVRSFHLNGAHLREQLVGLSDCDRAMRYIMLESPLPVTNYHARLSAAPVTDGNRAYVAWEAEFDVPEEHAAEVIDTLSKGVFSAGLDNLKNICRPRS